VRFRFKNKDHDQKVMYLHVTNLKNRLAKNQPLMPTLWKQDGQIIDAVQYNPFVSEKREYNVIFAMI
jgi:hypothetical protein